MKTKTVKECFKVGIKRVRVSICDFVRDGEDNAPKQILNTKYRINTILFAIVLVLACFSSKVSFGAEIKVFPEYNLLAENKNGKEWFTIYILGEITPGDAKTTLSTMHALIDAGKPISRVIIFSKGGDAFEAMEIGKWVRRLYIATSGPTYLMPNELYCHNFVDESSCTCDSACFIVWAGGIERLSDYIGVHRPSFDSSYFKGLSAEQAQLKYKAMSEEIVGYLDEMQVPELVTRLMFDTNSAVISKIDSKMIKSMGRIAFFDEWIIASCQLDGNDAMLWFELSKKNERTQIEQLAFEKLNEKRLAFLSCQLAKRWEAQKGAFQKYRTEIEKKYLSVSHSVNTDKLRKD